MSSGFAFSNQLDYEARTYQSIRKAWKEDEKKRKQNQGIPNSRPRLFLIKGRKAFVDSLSFLNRSAPGENEPHPTEEVSELVPKSAELE